MVTSGCQEAMIVALRGLPPSPRCRPRRAEPCYVGFTVPRGSSRIAVVPVPETSGGLRPESVREAPREVRASGRRPCALYVVPNFANPSGVSMSSADRRG